MEYYVLRPRRGNQTDLSSHRPSDQAHSPAGERGSFPAVHPSPDALIGEIQGIRRVLSRCGVPSVEHPDLAQEVLLGAWRRIAAGEYRPDPAADPTVALRGWLHRIAYNKAVHYRESARVRRERLAGIDPHEFVPEPAIDPRAFLEAREALRMVRHVGSGMRVALLEVASGKSFQEVGEEIDEPAAVIVTWFERGRDLLAAISEREVEK